MALYLLYRIGQFIVKVLPLNGAYRIAEILALIRYYLSKPDREIISKNLTVVLKAKGEVVTKERLRYLSRQVYKNFGKYLVEFFKFSKIDKQFIDRKVTIENIDKLDKLLSEGRGVICVSAHLGNWELGAAIVSSLGYSLNAIALPHSTKLVSHFFDKSRTDRDIRVIPLGMAIRRCFKALRKNEIVSFLGDKDFSGGGIKVRFMDRETSMPKGPAVISLKMRAPIIFAFLVRQKNNNFRLFFENPIYPIQSQDEEDAVRIITQRCVEVIERYIKDYPAQWLMFRKIWNS